MPKFTLAVCCLLVALAWLTMALATAEDRLAPPRAGDVVFHSSLASPQEQGVWPPAPFAQWVPDAYQGKPALRVTVPAADEKGSHFISTPLDLTRYRGCKLLFECWTQAEGVTKPPAPYLGLKFMLHFTSPTTGPYWHNQNDIFGDFPWKKLSFVAPIADDATGGEISLGLQDSAGTALFGPITVTVYKTAPPKRPTPMPNPPPAFKGHSLPRLRGVMSPNAYRDEDLRTLGLEWKANLIRWQITRNWAQEGTDRDLAEYDKWLSGRLDELDKALVACRKYGLKVVIDMHSPPGGRYKNSDLAIFNEPVYQNHFIAWWEKIARRYKGNPAVWGYDLINEPVQNEPSPIGVGDYHDGQARAAKAIRAIDPKVPIIIEATDWDSAQGYRELEPVDVPNVVYQVHMYTPGEFTHQGVYNKETGIRYPGMIAGVEWNKDRIRATLKPVRDFQLAYNVHIYVGEFSAIRWAPGAAQYLRDCIEVFEEYGWDWSYHAYREWDGWSVECGSDQNDHSPTAEPTDRKQLLLEWFAKNEKPRM